MLGRLFHPGVVDVGTDDVYAARRKSLGEHRSHSLGGPGDDGNLARQFGVYRSHRAIDDASWIGVVHGALLVQKISAGSVCTDLDYVR